jgi:GT2 family glycosyltransferase
VAVVVVTWAGGDWLARCWASLQAQTEPADRALIVVARGRPVPTPAGAPLRALPGPTGYAASANAGIRAAPGHAVLLLNDDTVCDPGLLAALRAARRAGGPGVYQPRIELAHADGRPAGIIDNTGHRLFFDGFNVARERGLPVDASRAPPCGEVGAFSGAAVWLCPEVIEATGGFDEDLHSFGEDLDLSLRARRLGFRLRFVDGALVRHGLGASYGRGGARKVFLVERNRVRAAVRSLPAGMLAGLPLWTVLRLGALGLAASAGRGIGAAGGPAGPVAALAGGLAGLAHTPDALRKRSADQRSWRAGDAEMWRHLLRHHARPADLLRPPAP